MLYWTQNELEMGNTVSIITIQAEDNMVTGKRKMQIKYTIHDDDRLEETRNRGMILDLKSL